MSGVEKAIEKAGTAADLAKFLGVTPQAVQNFKNKGWFPIDRARQVADCYGIPLAELVRSDIAQALIANS